MKGSTFHLQACIGFSDKREQGHSTQTQIIGEGIVYRYIYTFEKKIHIVSEFNQNFRDYIYEVTYEKVNTLSLKRWGA